MSTQPPVRHIDIVGGGTRIKVRPHTDLTSVAYGSTAKTIEEVIRYSDGMSCIGQLFSNRAPRMHLTKMAGGSVGDHPDDLEALAHTIINDPAAKIVFWTPAIVDFDATIGALEIDNPSQNILGAQSSQRLKSHMEYSMVLKPRRNKIINIFRQTPNKNGVVRKDLFVVGCKTTAGASGQEMYEAGLRLLKKASLNLVLVNDITRKQNMIVTPEEAAYHETSDREEVIYNLVEMTGWRSQLTFTQSTVVDGKPVPWNDPLVPDSLRQAVNHCIKGSAYKPFLGATVGHFAVKVDDNTFLTSIRKSDFNKLDENGLVMVKTDGPDAVTAYGAKPSVGGQSQRTVFRDHQGMDCILHFHSPLRANAPDAIPVVSQREVECGSHQCGENTSRGLAPFGNLKAVMLDNHGPNIVFSRNVDPQEVIAFIDRNFDLQGKTGGYNISK